jgi:ABC-2 type transport system permease protein
MRKILVVARREFTAAVKTKTFLISLLIMPLLMGGSIIVQLLMEKFQDTKDQTYAVIDRTPGAILEPKLKEALEVYNKEGVLDPKTKKQDKPRFILKAMPLESDSPEAVDQMREKLSEQVRKGDLQGFLEIGRRVAEVPPATLKKGENTDDIALRYQTNRLTQVAFRTLANAKINEAVQALRGEKAHLSPNQLKEIVQPVPLEPKGLSRRDATGKVEDTTQESLLAPLFVPVGMMVLMFMVIMMVANPMLQGVIEEKMQRIAEVLLGSVQPFQLMMGKLLGMTAVSLTISAVYLTGGYWAAWRYGFAEYLPVDLLGWFVLYQFLAGLLFGSLFIAIGAACTDMKEAQNLLLPVMLLVCMPMFVLGSVIKEPNSSVVTGLSFFPFATPMLMIARKATPPGIPIWQPLVGIVGVLATTVLCVWAAGRIFRVGLLMQGKGADLGQMVRWVFKG